MTDQTIDPKIIARIKKLHNMAEGAKQVGSLAEADAFMEAVQKTLAAHNLDMSVLSVDLHDLTDPMGSVGELGVGRHKKFSRHRRAGRPVEWVVDLAMAVAEAHYCASNYSTSSSYVWFYGRKSNRETAHRMFVYLRDMAERLGWDEYLKEARRRKKEFGTEQGMNHWRINWLEGFVAEVSRRYRAMRERVESDRGMSLVLTSVRKEAVLAAHGDVGARWKKILVPEDQETFGAFAGKRLFDIPDDLLVLLLKMALDAVWADMQAKKQFVSDVKALIKQNAEDKGFIEAEHYVDSARRAGAAAARTVNLNPHVVEPSAARAPKAIGGGS